MSGFTLAEATELRDAAKAAYIAALKSQQYSHGTRSTRRADLSVLAEELRKWNGEVARLERGGGIRITGATPT